MNAYNCRKADALMTGLLLLFHCGYQITTSKIKGSWFENELL